MPQTSETGFVKDWRGYMYAGAVVILFCSFVLVSRSSLSTALSPQDLAALRFAVSGVIFLPFVLRHGFGGLRARQVIGLACLGGLGFALFAYAGFALAPAAHGSILLHGTLALTTAVILFRSTITRPVTGQGIGLSVIALGVVAIAGDAVRHGTQQPDTTSLLLGDLSLLFASFCWSGYGIYVRRLEIGAVHATATVTVMSATIFLPVYILLPGKMVLAVNWDELVLQAVFQGVLIGACSIFVYTRAITLLDVTRVAVLTTAVPALTTLGGLFLLGEPISPATFAGLGCVTLGMLIVAHRLKSSKSH